ncbi:MAG: hypothetical protein LBL17_00355 [Coxiellaceae bacterium]|jgi:hypothetical protein|nr:hypothetical protein [Coxiellaceae bacterium]
MKKFFKIFSYSFLTLMLSGCFMLKHGNYTKSQNLQNKQNVAKLVDKLAKYDVLVLRRGNSVILALPNKRFFMSSSANFTYHANRALDLILGFASYYEGMSIAVTGCFKDEGDNFARALAIERSHKIVQYLWKCKTPANFIYVGNKNKFFCDGQTLSDYMFIEFVDFYFS